MPAPRATPTGAPNWNDLGTPDLEASVAFYSGLFGWTHVDYGANYGHYGAFLKDGAVVAGVGPLMSPQQPTTWTVYLQTSDAARTVDAVVAAGGRVVAPTMEVPEKGVQAVVADPSGAVFGLWQPGAQMGLELVAEASAPVWHELMTKDYAAAVSFYREALDWRVVVQGDTDEFRYAVHQTDGDPHAGIMDAARILPDEVPSHWGVYFGVVDTDAALARAVDLGATVVSEPVDSPFGRMAVLQDPQGAQFEIISVQDA